MNLLGGPKICSPQSVVLSAHTRKKRLTGKKQVRFSTSRRPWRQERHSGIRKLDALLCSSGSIQAVEQKAVIRVSPFLLGINVCVWCQMLMIFQIPFELGLTVQPKKDCTLAYYLPRKNSHSSVSRGFPVSLVLWEMLDQHQHTREEVWRVGCVAAPCACACPCPLISHLSFK